MKKTSICLTTAVIIAVSFFLVRCSNQSQLTKSFINPPFDGLNIAFNKFTIDASIGGSLNLENGSSLVIPPNAFIDGNGKNITGNVNLKYREFHDALDILIAGMPMDYDSAGTSNHFLTAGMFELQGYSKNKPVFIAKDKSIKVNFASNTVGNQYNFYELDTVNRNWTFRSNQTQATPNLHKDSLNKLIGEMPKKPIIPDIVTKDTKILDLNIRYDLYPEFKAIEGLMWTYSGSETETNPDNNKWVYKINWKNITLNRLGNTENKFELTLQSADKNFKTIVSPVLSEKNYKASKQKFDAQISNYNLLQKEYNDRKERASKEMEYLRAFSVNNFGVFNCDVIYKSSSAITINATFLIDGKKIDYNTIPSIIQVTGNYMAIIKYKLSNINSFTIDPSDDNAILAVLPDNKIALLNNKDIMALNLKQFLDEDKRNTKIDYTFNLKSKAISITTRADILSLLKNE